MRTVLLVDGDELFAESLGYLLEQAGFAVVVAGSGQAALSGFAAVNPNIVLLELQLPDMNGFDVCRRLRLVTAAPLIVVTASDDEVDKVSALELGADDYLAKPLSARELIARVTAVLRRYEAPRQEWDASVLTVGPVQVDVQRHRVTVRGVEVILRLKDLTALTYLMRNRGHLVSRARLIEHIWGEHFDGEPKRADAIIQRLRIHVETDPSHPQHLLTVRGLGYRIDG